MTWTSELQELQSVRRAYIRLAQELNPQATSWSGDVDRRWGKTTDNTGDFPHPGTVQQFGQFNNALANFEFPIELPSISSTLIDVGNEWRALGAQPLNLLRRKIGYYLRQVSDLEEIFDQLIAIGRIKTSSFPPGKVTLNLDIPGGDSLGAILGRRRVNNADFPRALPENIDAVVPFVYGHLTNGTIPIVIPDEEEPEPEDPCAACNFDPVVGALIYEFDLSAGSGSDWATNQFVGYPWFDAGVPGHGDPHPSISNPDVHTARAVEVIDGGGPSGENCINIDETHPTVGPPAHRNGSGLKIYPNSPGGSYDIGSPTVAPLENISSWDARQNRFSFDIRFDSAWLQFCIDHTYDGAGTGGIGQSYATLFEIVSYAADGGGIGTGMGAGRIGIFAYWGPEIPGCGIVGGDFVCNYLFSGNGSFGTGQTITLPVDTWLHCDIDWRCSDEDNLGCLRWTVDDVIVWEKLCHDVVIHNGFVVRTVEDIGFDDTDFPTQTNPTINWATSIRIGNPGWLYTDHSDGGKLMGRMANIRLNQITWEAPEEEEEEEEPGEGGTPVNDECATPDDLGAAQRGGWLRALLVDTGGGTVGLSDIPVPGGLAAEIIETGDPPPSISGSLVAGGEANTGFSYYYAIASITDGIFSELSNVVGPFSPSGANQQVNLSWGSLSPTPDAIRVYRSTTPDFSLMDRYYGPGDLPGTATGLSDQYPGYSYRGYPPSTADPHWDLNYRQTNYYQITAISAADGTESGCSGFIQVNLWPRNSPQVVRLTWDPVPGASSYRVRRFRQFHHFEMGATAQLETAGTSVDDNNLVDSAVSNCPTEATPDIGGGFRPTYLLAGHCLTAINEVFVFKPDPNSETNEFVQTLMVEGVDYEQAIQEINGNRYHVIIFYEQQRSETCQYYEVTANVDGASYEATVGGTLIEDMVDIVENIFYNVIFNTYRSSTGAYAPPGGVWFTDTAYSPGLINHQSFVDAKAASARKLAGGRIGAGALVEKIDARALIHDLLISSGLDLYQYLGSWYVKMFEPNLVVRASLPVIDPNAAIIRETFEPTIDDSKMVNVIPFFAGPLGGFSNSGFLVSGERRDPVSISDYGEMISEPFYLHWTQDAFTAVSVITDYLRQWSTPLLGARFTAPVGWYTSRPTDEVLVTSLEGLGAAGWTGHACRAIAVDLDMDSLLCQFTIRSIDALVP